MSYKETTFRENLRKANKFFMMNQLHSAMKLYSKLLSENSPDEIGLNMSYVNYAMTLSSLGFHDESKRFFIKAMKICSQKVDFKSELTSTRGVYSGCLIKQNKYDDALRVIEPELIGGPHQDYECTYSAAIAYFLKGEVEISKSYVEELNEILICGVKLKPVSMKDIEKQALFYKGCNG